MQNVDLGVFQSGVNPYVKRIAGKLVEQAVERRQKLELGRVKNSRQSEPLQDGVKLARWNLELVQRQELAVEHPEEVLYEFGRQRKSNALFFGSERDRQVSGQGLSRPGSLLKVVQISGPRFRFGF